MANVTRLIPLNTVREVVAAWGGTYAMARWCDIKPPSVSYWLHADCIPSGWHYRMDREARRNGYLINPALFGEKPTLEEAQHLQKERAS